MLPKPEQIFAFNQNIIDDIKVELLAQGHNLTGKTVESLSSSVTLENGTIVLEGFGSKVIAILDKGVEPAKTSMRQFMYLVRYFQARGLTEKNAKGAAAATIKKWAKEGMSTKASARFSETGERQSAVEIVFKEHEEKYNKGLGDAVDVILQSVFDEQKTEEV